MVSSLRMIYYTLYPQTISTINLDYSQVEVAADAARSACLNGKKMAVKIKNTNRKNVQNIVVEQSF